MKTICFILILLLSFSIPSRSQNKNLCGLTFVDTGIQIVSNLITFDLKWVNMSQKDIDNIQFSVDYYNVYGDYVTTKNYVWETGWFTDPIKSGTSVTYIKPVYVSSEQTIKKFSITINRIHFTDDTSCIK